MNLEGLNYDSKLSIDDLQFESDAREEAILDRTTIVFGGAPTGGVATIAKPRYGILDAINPTNIVASDASRPYIVTANTTNALTVDINAGSVVTPNGAIVTITTPVQAMSLARTVTGDILVVFAENTIIDADPTRITRYNVPEQVRRVQNTAVPGIVNSALLGDFTNAVLFPPSRLQNIVSLAIVTVVQTQTGTELQIDLSSSVYTFNRPWYSPVDVEHRSFIGTGVVTDNNPHATSFNDLSSGNLTLYQEILPYGVIQSRDDAFKGKPGYACTEVITPTRILTDTSGLVTMDSQFGGTNAKYVVLSSYPYTVGSMYLQSHMSLAVAYSWIQGTRILVLPPSEVFTENAIISYTRVSAAEPPASLISNTVTLGQPGLSSELIYSGGLAVPTLTNPSISFDGTGPVPRNFTLYVKGDGSVLRTPDVLQSTALLDSVGTAITSLTVNQFGPAYLSVGLANANSVPTMQIQIRLFGKDNTNTSIQEDIIFSGSTWVSTTPPAAENPSQFIRTDNIFASLTSFQVISRTDDGPNSQIVIFAEYESETTPALNSLVQVAQVNWSGLSISSVRDLRKVERSIPGIPNRYVPIGQSNGTGGSQKTHLFSEDFALPSFQETLAGIDPSTAAVVSIDVDDFSGINTGNTITFPNPLGSPVSVTATTNSAVTLGTTQFLAATSNQATRTSLVAAINGLVSGSTQLYTAVADPSTTVARVNVTANTLGTRGNGFLTTTITYTGSDPAISFSTTDLSISGGFDTYGEIHLVRHWDYVNSGFPLPSSSTYEVTNIRGRYQSKAIPVSNNTIELVAYGVPKSSYSTLQVRMRYTSGTIESWTPWAVVANDGNNFTLTGSGITKVQVEIFGKCSGFSLYGSN